MSTSTCERVVEMLAAFAGNDLDAGAAEAVRVHLIDCHACRGEAARFRRALVSLQRCGEQPPAGVDDAFFASMHATITARCATAEVVRRRPGWWRWPLAAAAAATLVATGFWWGHGPNDSVWDRPPLGTAVTLDEPRVDEPKAVPWSGPRVPLRLLGSDNGVDLPADDGARDPGSGLRARDRLRSLVDDGLLLPPRQRGR